MQITLSNQIYVFVIACLFGVILGIIYDLFRILRIVIRWTKIQIIFQDILYFSLSGVLTFLFMLAVNLGEVRLYIVVGEFLGWLVYYLTVGELVLKGTLFVVRILEKVFRKIKQKLFLPLVPVFEKLRNKLMSSIMMLKKDKKNIKINGKIT